LYFTVKKALFIIGLCILAAVLSGCKKERGPSRTPSASPGEIVEKVGDVGILRLTVPGFASLDDDDRIACYYLANALEESRDIPWDQIHPRHLEIRRFTEKIGLGLEYGALPEFTEPFWVFLKQLWIYGGFYDPRSLKKRPSVLDGRALSSLMFVSLSNLGGRLGTVTEINLKRSWMMDTLFVPRVEPRLIPRRPDGTVDLNGATPVNFYRNITLKEAAAFRGKYPHNSQLIRKRGRLREWVYRIGDETIAAGPYAGQLARVIDNLEKARPHLSRSRVDALDRLVDYMTTGDPDAFEAACDILRNTSSRVDFVLGFNDIRYDPLATRALWTGLLFITDEEAEKTRRILEEYCRANPLPGNASRLLLAPERTVKTAQLISAAGGDGLLYPNIYVDPPSGEVGGSSKQVLVFTNVIRDRALAQARNLETDLCPDDSSATRCLRCASGSALLENVARALTLPVKRPPVICLPEGDLTPPVAKFVAASALGEAALLWWLSDADIKEAGLLPDTGAVEETLHRFIRRYIITFGKSRSDLTITEAACKWLGNRLLDEKSAFTLRTEGTRIGYRMEDAAAFRNAIADVIVELAGALDAGNNAAVADLLKSGFQAPVSPGVPRPQKRRPAEQPLMEFAFLPPTVMAELNPMGGIKDVRLEDAPNLAVRMFQSAGYPEEEYDWLR
jgi:hypothetical protein